MDFLLGATPSVAGAAGDLELSPAVFLMKGIASMLEENALDMLLLRLEEAAPTLLLAFVGSKSSKLRHAVSTLSAVGFVIGSAASDFGAPAFLLMLEIAPMPEENTLDMLEGAADNLLDMLLKLEEAAVPRLTLAFVGPSIGLAATLNFVSILSTFPSMPPGDGRP